MKKNNIYKIISFVIYTDIKFAKLSVPSCNKHKFFLGLCDSKNCILFFH